MASITPKTPNTKTPKSLKAPSSPMTPVFKVELSTTSDWCMVITSTGNRFYHNKSTKQSVWNYPNDEVAKLVHQQDRNELLLLIAKARGLRVIDRNEQQKQEQKQLDAESASSVNEHQEAVVDNKTESLDATHPSANSGLEPTRLDADAEKKSSTPVLLGSGYESSDEESESNTDSEPELENTASNQQQEQVAIQNEENGETSSEYETGSEEEEEEQESDAEDGIDLDELDQFGSNNEIQSDYIGAQEKIKALQDFISLIESSNLNPYNSWELELQKIINDERFLAIELDEERKKIFDEWCSRKVNEASGSTEVPNIEDQGYDSDVDNKRASTDPASGVNIDLLDFLTLDGLEIEYSPVILYLEFLSTYAKPNKFYLEFKRKHRTNSELKDIELTDKDKEKIYLEFTNLKKKPVDERKQLLNDFLANSKLFVKNIKDKLASSQESVQRTWKVLNKVKDEFLKPTPVENLQLVPIDKAKNLAKHLQRLLAVPETIRENTIYYAVPTKERIKVLHSIHEILVQKP